MPYLAYKPFGYVAHCRIQLRRFYRKKKRLLANTTRSMTKWTSDRFPPNDARSILLWVVDMYSSEGIAIGYYDHDDSQFYADNAHDDEYAVTHWMDLPEGPPQEDRPW